MFIEQLDSRRLLAAGSVDRSFGRSGAVLGRALLPVETDFPSLDLLEAFTQPDRSTLVVARGVGLRPIDDTPYSSAAVAYRLKTDGSVDRTFAGSGFAILQVDRSMDFTEPLAAAVDRAGRLVIAAAVGRSPYYDHEQREGALSVLRLTRDGQLDQTFSGDGVAPLQHPAVAGREHDFNRRHSGVGVDAAGRIVVAVNRFDRPDTVTLVRLRDDGSFDRTFDADGQRTLTAAAVSHLGIDADNRVVFAGSRANGANEVYRLTARGKIDQSFSGDGRIVASANGFDFGQLGGLVVTHGGSIAVVGASAADNTSFAARFDSTGRPDAAFGSGGLVRLDAAIIPEGVSTFPSRLVVRNDGALTIGLGFRSNPGQAILRLSSRGSLVYLRRLNADRFDAQLLGQQPDGKLLFAEYQNIFRTTATGEVDHSFDSRPLLAAYQTTGVVDASGRFNAGLTTGGAFGTVRFSPTGALDRSHGDRGVLLRGVSEQIREGVSVGAPDVYAFGDGRVAIITQGNESDGDGIAGLFFMQQPAGTVDPRFPDPSGSEHFAPIESTGQEAQKSAGGIFTVFWRDYTYSTHHLMMFAPDGRSVGAIGYVDLDAARGFAPSSAVPIRGGAGGLYVTGASIDPYGEPQISGPPSLRRRVNGEYDRTFGDNGVLRNFDGSLVAAQSDASVLYTRPGRTGLFRLKFDGSPDGTFGNRGVAAAGFDHFDVDAAGRIIAWRMLTTGGADGDVQVMRLTRNGKIDPTFGGGDGVTVVDTRLPSGSGRQTDVLVTPDNRLVVTAWTRFNGSSGVTWSATRLTGD